MTLTENCTVKYNEEMFQFYVLLAAAAFVVQSWSRFVTDVTTAHSLWPKFAVFLWKIWHPLFVCSLSKEILDEI